VDGFVIRVLLAGCTWVAVCMSMEVLRVIVSRVMYAVQCRPSVRERGCGAIGSTCLGVVVALIMMACGGDGGGGPA